MKRRLFTTLFTISTLFGFAQGITTIDFSSEYLRMSRDMDDESNIIGSAYIQEEFSPVRVKGYENQIYLGRYNAYNGQMVIDVGEKKIAVDVEKDTEVRFTQLNTIYRTYSYTDPDNIKRRGFLVVVEEGDNYALLKEQKVDFIEAVEAASSYQQDKPAKFKRASDNYYIETNGTVSYVPSKKKSFLKQFASNEKAIKSFIKENSISLKDEQDLKQLAEFIATLP